MMTTEHLWSNLIAVGPCLCPILFNVVRMGTYSSVFIKPDPVSDSYIEDITASIILLFMRTSSLHYCFYDFVSAFCIFIFALFSTYVGCTSIRCF